MSRADSKRVAKAGDDHSNKKCYKHLEKDSVQDRPTIMHSEMPDDPHKNAYICFDCRSKMATEIFVSCADKHEQPLYCSDCVSNTKDCPWCSQIANGAAF